ncbi:hypothetical protein C1645_878168 [Glomus cerebriforme]|uniref:Sel1 repeat domain-containing protein n=1 Tax=Glomus cerebriforme TaxID=658196 RepID=A0A397ST87_9GLOM|nr:hypothetical protein C1645_878168 [Glomus cerebriforme]
MSDNQLNSDNIDISNTKYLFQIIQNFDKINVKEIEPTTKNINETIFEEDLSIVIDELIEMNYESLSKGEEENVRKQRTLDYINNHKINLQEIYKWLLNNQNNSNSIYLLGYFNYHGIETNVNKKITLELYQKATEFENSIAQLDLAIMYIDGEDVDANYLKAFELLKKLTEENTFAINTLAYCYNNGIGTDVSEQKAFELYQKAADLEDLNGINLLGYCYEEGIGTNINKQKAFELYQKAAKLGHDVAQYNLALMYENGEVVEKNIDQAIYWYKKSAEQEFVYAQEELEKLL